MEKMKISVIIPVYNGEQYIAQCLENVLCQTYKELEIVVVNDGSTDRTAEIVASCSRGDGAPPIKLVTQKQSGVAVARNAGIAAATGEYFHFLDADDWIDLDFYAAMADTAALTDADMVFCSYVNEMWPHSSLLYDRRYICVEAEDKYSLSMTKALGYSWRYLCRRELVTRHALAFPEGWLLEDIPFTVQAVYHARKVATAPDAVYRYKMRAGSALNRTDKAHARLIHEHWKRSKKFGDDFLRSHDLGTRTVEVRPTWRYKLFGRIPVAKKMVYPSGGKTNWWLFGIPVLKKLSGKSRLAR